MVRRAVVDGRRAAVASAVCIAACAPAAPPPTPGALVLVVDTNLAPGRDFDRLALEIDEAPEAARAWAYAVDPVTGRVILEDAARLPLTVSLQNARMTPAERHVHLTAWRAGRAIFARDVSVVLPATEARALRVTVDELCVGEAVSLEGTSVSRTPWVSAVGGRPVSCGGGGLTCVGGACVDAHVDGSALEIHDPRGVFGGAAEPSEAGRCSDVRACFSDEAGDSSAPPVALLPRRSAVGCGVQVLSGTTAADAFTVAHETEGGRGRCGPGGCLAWLDRTSKPEAEGGWWVRGDRLLVPEALCTGARRVYLARTRRGRCVGKSRATPACSPWSSTGPRTGGDAPSDAALIVDGARDDGVVCGRVTRSADLCASVGLACGALAVADPLCASAAVDARTLGCGPCGGDTAGMVRFEGGVFPMGSTREEIRAASPVGIPPPFENEGPVHIARVAPFWLDAREVTADAYAACVRAGVCTAATRHDPASEAGCNAGAPGRGDHPINCVTRAQAAALCSWRGLRLPTEEEWEFAARGGGLRRRFPWGEDAPARPDARACAGSRAGRMTCAAGASTGDVTPEGVHDLAGNVREWVSSGASPSYAEAAGSTTMSRGGAYASDDVAWLRGAVRTPLALGFASDTVGFRCARGE